MKSYTCKMFKDFGFKLVVINALLRKKTSFGKTLLEMKAKYDSVYEMGSYECIPEILEYIQNLLLTKEDLAQVTSLCFDYGLRIYYFLMPDWDGESDEFDVNSVEDYVLLPNLKDVVYLSMCDQSLIDTLKEKGITVRYDPWT